MCWSWQPDAWETESPTWDNSLKALARYPVTVKMLDDNLAWTTDLGQAFLNQPGDVMDYLQAPAVASSLRCAS